MNSPCSISVTLSGSMHRPLSNKTTFVDKCKRDRVTFVIITKPDCKCFEEGAWRDVITHVNELYHIWLQLPVTTRRSSWAACRACYRGAPRLPRGSGRRTGRAVWRAFRLDTTAPRRLPKYQAWSTRYAVLQFFFSARLRTGC